MIPDELLEVLRAVAMCQFATFARDGTPINTEMLLEFGEDGTLDVSTGLAYPAKAERARRRPRVGLLVEVPGGPVVSVSALSAVRDADIAANGARYRSRFAWLIESLPGGDDPDAVADAVWYWSRIYVECHPVRISWWPSADDLDRPPERWTAEPAPAPRSDPAPTGAMTSSGAIAAGDWHERAAAVRDGGVPAHLTTLDSAGHPRPAPVKAARVTATGFDIEGYGGMPIPASGRGCLTFGGQATFLGQIADGALVVERMLPDLALVADTTKILRPDDPTKAHLMDRLDAELARRGQSIPSRPAV